MRRHDPPSILLPPDYEEQCRRRRRERVRAVVRSPWTPSSLVAVFVALFVFRPVPVQASFQALLAQTIEYVSILMDEWEKHSRILEDHLDRVTGIMQPFSDIHAGVRELMDTRGLTRTLRMVDTYRASVANPECYTTFPPPLGCTLQADFTPPEARSLVYTARRGMHAAGDPLTLFELEEFAFSPSGLYQGMNDVLRASGNDELADRIEEVEENIGRNRTRSRWNMRRVRSVQQRAGHASRLYLYTSPQDADGCPVDPVGIVDAHGNEVDVRPDATVLDQVASADCLGSAGHVDDPLEPKAHLSEDEAGLLQANSLIGVADLVTLQLEAAAVDLAAALEGRSRADARRRSRLAALERRQACIGAPNPTVAYADSTGDCNVGGAVADIDTRSQAYIDAEEAACFVPGCF